MSNYLNNALVYLFNEFETRSDFTLNTFILNESSNQTFHNQPRMQEYADTVSKDGTIYKYLYDPELSFSWRFHQRLAKIKYTDRKGPWITLMFNTGIKEPLTNLVSHNYTHYETTPTNFYSVPVRRNKANVDIVFMSNSEDYLYDFLGKLNFWFDRSTGFYYKQTISYSNSHVVDYELAGDVYNITQKDLNKLDTERRGSIVSAGLNFDVSYWEMIPPEQGHLLKHINVEIKVVDDISSLSLIIQ